MRRRRLFRRAIGPHGGDDRRYRRADIVPQDDHDRRLQRNDPLGRDRHRQADCGRTRLHDQRDYESGHESKPRMAAKGRQKVGAILQKSKRLLHHIHPDE
ncbi:hypothetical protein SDC9_197386 [bioreactor metagenome]|uniref:Uncharacterized protein n=1 Tax=bioreactor metagenome TaxID=1076179 RepID=A0A645IN57_9ZZZZ